MDKELEPRRVLTSEELRTTALAASARRGFPVARRRIVLRWSTWLLWRCLLPVIGLTTVLAALLAFASIEFLGPDRVFDTSQAWLAEQLGVPKTKTKAVSDLVDHRLDNNPATLPNVNVKPGVIPQLQIDRNYPSYDQSNAVAPPASALSTTPATLAVPNPSSLPKPPGAQP